MKIKSGTFTGNGVDGRQITVGWQPDLVMVINDSGDRMAWRIASHTGDQAHFLDSSFGANLIQAFGATYFELGTQANTNGQNYLWVAIQDDGADFAQGQFTGNGADNRSISGLGFQPDFVHLETQTAANIYATFKHVSQAAGASQHYDGADSLTDHIQAIEADGFQVGTHVNVNENGSTIDWFAFKNTANKFKAGTYTGNGADNRNITGIGFQPSFVIVKKANNTGGGGAQARATEDDLSDSSYSLINQVAAADRIQGFHSDGFTVGTHNDVNTNGDVYYYMAFKGETSTAWTKELTEIVTITDTKLVTLSRLFSETVIIVDVLTTVKILTKQLLETITIVDTLLKTIVAKILTEIITLADTLLKLPGKVLPETIVITDTIIKIQNKILSEIVTITDYIQKFINGLFVTPWVKIVKEASSVWTKVAKEASSTWTKVVKEATSLWTKQQRPE